MTEPKRMIVVSGRQLALAAVAILASVGAMTGISMLYTNYETQKSNHAWCDVINSLNERYSRLPPDADPKARVFARQIAVISNKFEC